MTYVPSVRLFTFKLRDESLNAGLFEVLRPTRVQRFPVSLRIRCCPTLALLRLAAIAAVFVPATFPTADATQATTDAGRSVLAKVLPPRFLRF
jgi:hypothetical protein